MDVNGSIGFRNNSIQLDGTIYTQHHTQAHILTLPKVYNVEGMYNNYLNQLYLLNFAALVH